MVDKNDKSRSRRLAEPALLGVLPLPPPPCVSWSVHCVRRVWSFTSLFIISCEKEKSEVRSETHQQGGGEAYLSPEVPPAEPPQQGHAYNDADAKTDPQGHEEGDEGVASRLAAATMPIPGPNLLENDLAVLVNSKG